MQHRSNAVLFAGAAIFVGWVILHFGGIAGDDGGVIRFVLGAFLPCS